MTDELPADLQKLFDDYLAGELDPAGLAAFSADLARSPELRNTFVSYANLHTQLELHFQRQKSLAATLQKLGSALEHSASEAVPAGGSNPSSAAPPPLNLSNTSIADVAATAIARQADSRRQPATRRQPLDGAERPSNKWLWVAASVLGLSLAGWWMTSWRTDDSPAVAWIVNAQNCDWNRESIQRGQFKQRQKIEIDRGLLEIGFLSQAQAVIEGPAELVILSGNQVHLLSGNISVKMPTGKSGFEVLTPGGRILDLGTEFGVSVRENGQVDVAVFDGEVLAFAGNSDAGQRLHQAQLAQLQSNEVQLAESLSHEFVRKIVPPPIRTPRRKHFDFSQPTTEEQSSTRDVQGHAIGLSRLSATGQGLPINDPNLMLDQTQGVLNVRATRSDINHQRSLDQGEFLGLTLSELGFTGSEDFEVNIQVLNTPNLEGYGQYGIYVANDSQECIRGGVIRWTNPQEYTQFLVNTWQGIDQDSNQLGYISPGSDIEICLRRADGKYSLEVRDLKNENSNTLQIRHPSFLDGCRDLQVGFFVSNPFHDQHATVTFDSLTVTVWNEHAADSLESTH